MPRARTLERCSADGCDDMATYATRKLCTVHYMREYHQRNKTKLAARASAAYRANPEPAKQRARAHYRAKPPELVRAQRQAWIDANPERHAEIHRQKEARRRALKRSAEVKRFTPDDWQRLINRHGGCCAYCGARASLSIDHVVPLSRGGRHAEGNILPACTPCNSSKHARLLAEWRRSVALV